MKYRIDFSNGQYSKIIEGAGNTKQFLRSLADGTVVSDVRIIYRSGVSDSVMDAYKKYIPQDPKVSLKNEKI